MPQWIDFFLRVLLSPRFTI